MRCLVILLLVSSVLSQDFCEIKEDTCNENTLSPFIHQTYETIMKFLGFDVNTNDSKRSGLQRAEYNACEKYTESENDKESIVDTFQNEAQALLSLMAEDSGNVDTKIFTDVFRDTFGISDKTIREDSDFEYHPLKRIDPVQVGHIKTIKLSDGRTTTMKTLAKQPPLFEIENFLTDEECDHIVEVVSKDGMNKSRVFVDLKTTENDNHTSMDRNSDSASLKSPKISTDFLRAIHERISAITDIPVYVIKGSEPISIVRYKPGGYYHAHHDSTTNADRDKPCCFQSACKFHNGKHLEGSDCCNLCRYASFLYYLNDVDGGGETAFPFADTTMSGFLKRRSEFPDWKNLTRHCQDSNVVVRPSKGKAIFWYNHYLDPRGYLGGADWRSHHGGCHVTSGTKWIATNWISIPTHSERFTPGRFENVTDAYEHYNKRKT